MIRFILVQVKFHSPCYPNLNLIVSIAFIRIAKARHGCRSGMFHMMMKRRYALLDLHGVPELKPWNKLRLRGEVHRVVAARDQKYQSNFVEVRKSPHCCRLL